MSNWREQLKVGDKVVVCSSYAKRVHKVTKITKTLIVVGTARFRKKTGTQTGDCGWSRPRINEATKEEIASIEAVQEAQKRKNQLFELKKRIDGINMLPLNQQKEVQLIADITSALDRFCAKDDTSG